MQWCCMKSRTSIMAISFLFLLTVIMTNDIV
nr:MAG TPA: hypothetical protein [Siphoviridae sp. ctqtA1]